MRLVPFGREIRRGTRGRDVVALKRALAKAGYGRWGKFTQSMGPIAVRNLRRFQQTRGLHVDGVYGRQTHAKLARFFDDYGAYMLAGVAPKRKTVSKADRARLRQVELRNRVVAAMTLLYNNRAAVHYTQGPRRMEGVTAKLLPPRFPVYADCSAAATWAYFAAGAPDPNGRGYDGFGYTGTLCVKGRRVTLAHAKPGDLVFYGAGAPWQHVAIYIGGGRVLSHGSEAGPYLLPIDYRADRGEIRAYL